MLNVRLCIMLFVVILLKKDILFANNLSCDDIFVSNNKFVYIKSQPKNITQITNCLQRFSNKNLTRSDTAYIWESIVNLFNSGSDISEGTYFILRWMIPRLNIYDYAKLTFADIDIVQNFGLDYNLTEEQLSEIADRVRKDFASKEPEDYTMYDLTALRNILCGFNKREIERIHPSAYKEASEEIGKLKCKSDVMTAFATLAVHKQAYGPADNWDDEVIKTVGEVTKYLPKKS